MPFLNRKNFLLELSQKISYYGGAPTVRPIKFLGIEIGKYQSLKLLLLIDLIEIRDGGPGRARTCNQRLRRTELKVQAIENQQLRTASCVQFNLNSGDLR